MDLFEPTAIDPLIVHEIGCHAAPAVGMAAVAVELLIEPLACADRVGVVVILRGAGIVGNAAARETGHEGGVDHSAARELTHGQAGLRRPALAACREQGGQSQ